MIDPSPHLAQLVIRQATRGDLPCLEWEGEFTHFRRIYAEAYRMVESGKGLIWVAELNGTGVIGQLFVSLHGNRPELSDGRIRAYIYGFRVRPAYRNLGIGTNVMYSVEADLSQRGFRKAVLNVARQNHDAIRFYKRLGYQIVGSEEGHWSYLDEKGQRIDVHEPAWRIQKDLTRYIGITDE